MKKADKILDDELSDVVLDTLNNISNGMKFIKDAMKEIAQQAWKECLRTNYGLAEEQEESEKVYFEQWYNKEGK